MFGYFSRLSILSSTTRAHKPAPEESGIALAWFVASGFGSSTVFLFGQQLRLWLQFLSNFIGWCSLSRNYREILRGCYFLQGSTIYSNCQEWPVVPYLKKTLYTFIFIPCLRDVSSSLSVSSCSSLLLLVSGHCHLWTRDFCRVLVYPQRQTSWNPLVWGVFLSKNVVQRAGDSRQPCGTLNGFSWARRSPPFPQLQVDRMNCCSMVLGAVESFPQIHIFSSCARPGTQLQTTKNWYSWYSCSKLIVQIFCPLRNLEMGGDLNINELDTSYNKGTNVLFKSYP